MEVSDFPEAGQRARVYLGDIPQFVLDARRAGLALGRSMLRTIFRTSHANGMSLDDMAAQEMAHISDDELKGDYKWFVTLAIESIESIENVETVDFDERHYAATLPAIDILAAMLMTAIPRHYFSKVLFERVVLTTQDRGAFCIPRIEGHAPDVAVITKDPSRLLESLKKVQESDLARLWESRKLLATPCHCHLASIAEDDHTRRFLFSFLALEILTQKYFKSMSKPERATLLARFSSSLSSLLRRSRTPTLACKFRAMADDLIPERAEEDSLIFMRVKKARDRLVHDDIDSAAELPFGDAVQLAERYLLSAIDKFS